MYYIIIKYVHNMTSITEINITNMNIGLLLLLRFLYKARNETINNNIDIR